MPSRFRTIAKRTLIVLNIITALFYLLACLAPYTKPTNSWFISVLGLAFPFLLALLIGFVFLWLILKIRMVWLPLLVLLFGFKSISVFIGFNKPAAFRYEKNRNRYALPAGMWPVSWSGKKMTARKAVSGLKCWSK